MTHEQIAARLRDALETLDDAVRYVDADPDTIADLDAVLCDLTELRREIEMVPFRNKVPA
jgi:hypothetical protein